MSIQSTDIDRSAAASPGPQSSYTVNTPNIRSCVACAQRKLRCDKQQPCARCQRAGVSCISPAPSSCPRWTGHKVAKPSGADVYHSSGRKVPRSDSGNVADRLRALENVVLQLSSEATRDPNDSQSVDPRHSGTAATAASLAAGPQPEIGQLNGRYNPNSTRTRTAKSLSGSFWANIGSELQSLRERVDHSEVDLVSDESRSAHPQFATERGLYTALLAQTSAGASSPSPSTFPLPSEMPFLLEIYMERVQAITALPHLPSLRNVFQRRMGESQGLSTFAEDALISAVCFAASESMDEDEVFRSFGKSQDQLTARYRRGFELSLVAADFLNKPSYELVEALTIFMTLSRWRDPPIWSYMMTGLVIRMARYLGYDREGAGRQQATPFMLEMQRRLWWNICILDLRATEDQGTVLTIAHGSYTTALPARIHEHDIWPDMTQPPVERPGLTATSLLRLCCKTTLCTQAMMASSSKESMSERISRLSRLAQEYSQDFFGVPGATDHKAFLAAAGTLRVFVSRLTLLAFHAELFASPSQEFSSVLCNKLTVAAIEMAEHNHALNEDPSCKPWRWVYQTQQHWHAVVFLLIEVCRREWSPLMERAWCALSSRWLLPNDGKVYENPTIWVPLKQLISCAKRHREEELRRLRHDLAAATALERSHVEIVPLPSTSTTFPAYYNDADFIDRWRRLVSGENSAGNKEDVNEGLGSQNANLCDTSGCSKPSETMRTVSGASCKHTQRAVPLHEDVDAPMALDGGAHTDGSDLAFLSQFLDEEIGLDDHAGISEEVDLLEFDWEGWLASAALP